MNSDNNSGSTRFSDVVFANGSAQLTFQIIVYSFAKIPCHRLLLCDWAQCP